MIALICLKLASLQSQSRTRVLPTSVFEHFENLFFVRVNVDVLFWLPRSSDELYTQKLKYKAISEELDHALNDMTSM